MQWITAILAFAVTMLVFAIIVSTLVEMIHRVWDLRAGGMRLMLENIYTKVIAPHLAEPKPDAAEFASIIMENRATARSGKGRPAGRMGRFLHWLLGADRVTSIPVEIFTQKLADSRIVKSADAFTDEVLADIGQKYEAFGREASAYFESRARFFSVLVAMGVAVAFFVHPYKIAVTYVKNPELAEAMADQAQRVSADFSALELRMQQAAAAQGAGTSEQLQSALNDLRDAWKDAGARSRELASAGVPIGWPGPDDAVAPCFAGPGQPEPGAAVFREACTLPIGRFSPTVPTLWSAIWLMIGGLLVGLGAPFWARAVSSLAAARGVSERIAEIVSQPGLEAGAEPAPRTRSGKPGPAATRRPKPVSSRTFELSRSTEAKKK